MAGRKAVQAPSGANEVSNCLSGVLREKASSELNNLNLKLDDGLRDDIARAYTECLFSDLTLIFHTTRIRTHKSLLQARAPSFYRELLLHGGGGGASKKSGLTDRLTVQLIETFIRELYSKNAIKHKEDAVVAQIRVISCCKDAGDNSPESDVFVTPKASPSEAPFSKQSFEGRSRYYNIAHIEEDFERELAEQDALSSSFLSIITKEEEEQRSREPTTLDFTKEPPPPPVLPPPPAPVKATVVPVTVGQCVDQDIARRRALALKQLNKQLTYSWHSSEEVVVEMKDKQPAPSCGGGLTEEATSSSACFDALTSGYVTGGSPKGNDSMTEVASSGEMPHDDDYPSNDEDSSVSSDQGTWDTFPTHDEPTYVERENIIKPESLNKQTELSAANNFFIDASSLIDENELPCLPPVQPTIEPNGATDSVDPVTPPPSTVERSLIRRNTFEFDPDDVKLKALRDEYDKNCSSKDDHSPDSLNNDTTGESFADGDESKVRKANDSSSPQYSGQYLGGSDLSNSNSLWSLSAKCETDTNSLRDQPIDKSRCSYFDKLESIPIVSGAAQPSGLSYTGSDVSLTNSPLVNRRRNEQAPILSGAAPPSTVGGSDSDCGNGESKNGRKSRSGASSLSASWVVDMSDVGVKSSVPSESSGSVPPRKKGSTAMGFFVPFDDPFPSLDSSTSMDSSSNRSGCGFYVDLKDLDAKDSSLDKQNSLSSSSNPEKKLFSMFIDIGDAKESSSAPRSKPSSPFLSGTRRVKPVNPLLSVQKVKSTSTSSDSGLDCAEHVSDTGVCNGSRVGSSIGRNQLFDSSVSDSSTATDSAFSTKRQSFYMFIEAEDSPVTRRRTLPSGVKHPSNRHSWNSDKSESNDADHCDVKQYKRSGSVSCDSSALRLELVRPSSELNRLVQNGSLKDQGIGESMDKPGDETTSEAESSAATTTTTDHRTFVVDDVSKAVNVSSGGATDLDLSTPSRDVTTDLSGTTTEQEATPTREEPPNSSSLNPDQTVSSVAGGFVKLSDMDVLPSDSPLWAAPISVPSTAKSSRMTRSIPSESGSWLDSKIMANSASSRSLSRLFPHLYPRKAFEASDDYSNQSSSMQSSSVSPLEISSDAISEESSGPGTGDAAISRLGQDLLRMFLDGISPDVTLDVAGRRIKAHKCILSSRCQYFAGMLSGGWVESAGNVISLQGFSYNAVHFALCHIYSGASNIPDTINIVELATLADMLCLEGLKEVIMYTLKVKYCHFFHKPCPGCTAGILECLPLAAAYGLDEIYRKSLKWITRYFVKVWPNKGFATLPKELRDKCYKQHVIFMSSETVLETIMGCEKLEAAKSNVRWAQPVFAMIAKLQEAATKYLTDQFASVLGSDAFAAIGKQDVWTMTRLEETLVNCSRNLSPDQSCQSYKKVKSLLKNIRDEGPMEESEWKIEFLELLTQLEISVEDCLVRQAGRAARTISWSQLDLSLRKKIQEKACLVFAPGLRSSSLSKASESRFARSNYSERNHSRTPSETGSVRTTTNLLRTKVSTPSVQKVATSTTRSKRPPSAHSSTSTASLSHPTVTQLSHGPSSSGSSTATKRTSPRPTRTANKSTQSSNSVSRTTATKPPPTAPQPPPRPKVNPKLAQVKSRYLEPLKRQTRSNDSDETASGRSSSVVSSSTRRLSSGGRVLSSSDSSRNSSPATSARSIRSRPSTAGAKSRLGGQTFNANSTHVGTPPACRSIGNNRPSTLRSSTKSSQAKVGPPKTQNTSSSAGHNNNTNRHPLISTRSSTFLKEPSTNATNKKPQTGK